MTFIIAREVVAHTRKIKINALTSKFRDFHVFGLCYPGKECLRKGSMAARCPYWGSMYSIVRTMAVPDLFSSIIYQSLSFEL